MDSIGPAIKLTEWTSCGGCAAKWGASLLSDLVHNIPVGLDPSLLVGLAPFDDAAVYQVAPDVALVSTTDFFPPLVDDPADFGAIAAANACSDVFAMGGRVVLAVNIAAFPEELPRDVISEIFASAAAVVSEAGGTIAGGHTIRNPEPIFGLAVQGVVNPSTVFRKSGAVIGDVALLSKRLGTGLVTAVGSDSEKKSSIAGMRMLNRRAAESLQEIQHAVHAVTDVTGYGLAGHGWEMAERSGVALEINTASLPLYDGALRIAQTGHRTGGDARNRQYVDTHITSSANDALTAICFDPQTSGGLLAAVAPESAHELIASGLWTQVGDFVAGTPAIILK